jgi:hypothetical protein
MLKSQTQSKRGSTLLPEELTVSLPLLGGLISLSRRPCHFCGEAMRDQEDTQVRDAHAEQC